MSPTTEVHAIDLRLTSHEAVCAERYKNIDVNMERVRATTDRIQQLVFGVAGAVILQLLGAIGYLLTR